jgi:uncharacterized protein
MTRRTSQAVLSLAFVLFLPAVIAAEINLDADNPAIQKIKARMADRSKKIEQWKNSGAIGEAATGLVEPRPVASQGLPEKKEVRDLVVAENEDRYALFRELVIANNLPAGDLASVAAAFAKSRRDAAASEHWVQNPSDKQWLKKKDLK